ncbi:MAG TPA: methyltransferase domain-containing protein [Acholeplasmataceae bacterium]|nr:methyltransferase domain-containing protein [Acholeplasmataceae bacterium]
MLASESIDIIVENAMLHLVDNPDKVLKEMNGVLKPGGYLIRYGTYGLPLSDEEKEININCNKVLNDISDVFHKTLENLGQKVLWFDNHFQEYIPKYFHSPYGKEVEGFSEVFTEKLKFRLYKLKTGAHSGFQTIPKEFIDIAWNEADKYARAKYGENYIDIKGFSRYGTGLDIYKKIKVVK